jgi:hypothetical protein
MTAYLLLLLKIDTPSYYVLYPNTIYCLGCVLVERVGDMTSAITLGGAEPST